MRGSSTVSAETPREAALARQSLGPQPGLLLLASAWVSYDHTQSGP